MTETPKMIERRMVFGTREDVRNGIHYFDDDNIVWVAGKSLVLLDTQLGTQQLISCSPTCETVTAMALSSNRRVLAVAESGKSVAIVIYVFDSASQPRLKRKKVLQLPDLGSTEYISLNFSHDGKSLIALGGFPEWKLVYWNVEKMKMIASCPAVENAVTIKDPRHLNTCSLCPRDSSVICVTGNGIVHFFRMVENHLFPTTGGLTSEGTQYLSHIWIPTEPSRVIVSTDNGDLLLFDNQEYLHPLPLSPSDGLSLNTMIAYTKGFVCGGDMGLITIFEQTDSKEMFRKVRTFRFTVDGTESGTPQNSAEIPTILSFALTPPPAEEYLAFLTSTKQLYSLNLPNADFAKAEEMVFQPVGQPFHSGPVTGVDSCAQRSLVVTAGRDRCIFLWNTITNIVEMRKKFDSEILSVAIHPSGLHLLVGFADGLKLMNIYDKDIVEYRSVGIRGCSACCFSNGGQFFAAMHSTTIHVYYTYTCELLGHLRGHNGKVKSIYFVPPDDTRIISTGTDGAVFEYSLCDFHKVNDAVQKSITYSCGVADVATVWAVGNDRKLRQFERASLGSWIEYDLNNASAVSLGISQSMKLLFGGCEDGTVRVFNTYLGEKLGYDKESGGGGTAAARSIMIENHAMHSGAVTQLALTHDEGMLVSVGDDGVVVFWDVVAPHRGIGKDTEYSNELLMDRNELEANAKLVAELQAQVAELKQRMVQQQAKRERAHEEQLARLEREYSDEVKKHKAQIEDLESEKNEQAIRFTEFMAELEDKNTRAMQQTQEDYDSKISSLEGRAEQLRRLIGERRVEYEAKAARFREQAADYLNTERERQQTILREMDAKHNDMLMAKERDDAETELICKMIEEDNDVEIITEKENFEKRRREQEEELAVLQSQNSALVSKENLNKADLEAKLADVTEKLRQQATLEAQIEAAKRDIEALSNELRERGETIAEKDRRVYDLKKKNQELEKFKFVLEYKIKELKAQIDPRDEEIREAKEKLASMEEEAQQYQKSNENLVLQIRSLRQKRAGQQKEIDGLKEKKSAGDEFQSRLWTELIDVREEIDNPRRLKEMAKALLDKYATDKPPRTQPKALTSRTATDEVREYNRERDHLERNLASLKKKVSKDAENGRSDKNRITAENIILVKEVNDLRKEARTLAARAGVLRETDPTGASAYDEDYRREAEVQRAEIERLRVLAGEMEAELQRFGIPLPTSLQGTMNSTA